MKDQSLRVLMVEDSENDALLIIRELKKGGYDPVYERVETAAAMKKALKENQWDIILCDYKMPGFSCPSAIALLKKTNIDIPLIIVSGAIGEEAAVDCMRLGARDYIMKGNLSRLCPAIARELEDAKVRNKQKQAKEELRESDERFRLLSEATFEAIAIHEEGVLLNANDQYFKMFGHEPDEALGKEMISATFAPESLEFVKKRIATDSLELCEAIGLRKDGTRFPMEIRTRKMEYKRRTVRFGTIRDITERKRAEDELRKSEEKYRELVRYAPAGIYEYDYETNRFISVNDVVCEYTGYTRNELLTMNIFNILTEESQKLMLARLEKLMANELSIKPGEVQTVEYCIITKGGEELWVRLSTLYIYESGKLKRSTGVVYNITERKQAEEALKESERRYRELSIIDDLTQLYNSKHFHAQIGIEMERSNSYFYGQPLTLLLLDIDKFKAFNDQYGRAEGDHMLSRLGQMVKRCLRETDSAYRYGGGEISIILPMTAIEEGIVKAKRIQAELKKETFSPVPDQNIYITVNIGLAQYKPMEEMKTFVQRVEKLMDQAKKDGRDRICSDASRAQRSFIGSI
jgi:diguanylate cyclase (GGDEF)-like protein/PAS domain S-box-containing protein